MPSIGDQDVITLKGLQVQDPKLEVEEITRPDVDGHAFRQLALQGQTVSMVSTVDVDAGELESTKEAYAAMQGTLVDVELDDGLTVEDVMVLNTMTIQTFKNAVAVGGRTAGLWVIRQQWVFKGTKVS